MDVREKLNEFAELRGWNKNKLIGWSEAADFGEWFVKNCFIPDIINQRERTTPLLIEIRKVIDL